MTLKPKRTSKRQRLTEAADWYDANLELHNDLAEKVEDLLKKLLAGGGILFDKVESRVKERKSFLAKADKQERRKPKYPDPTKQITDVVGVRIVTKLLSLADEIGEMITKEFIVDPHRSPDKTKELGTNRVGYRGKHFVVTIDPSRLVLSEWKMFEGWTFEIQIHTMLQHAWADIEHDRRFKSPGDLPDDSKRRFSLLAGQLELADIVFNTLAAETDAAAQKVAKNAAGTEASEKLTPVNLIEYMSGTLATEVTKGLVEPGFDENWAAAESVSVLKEFGVETLGDLSSLFPMGYLDQYPDANGIQTTFKSLLRSAMILRDAEKYFKGHALRQIWDTFEEEEVEFFSRHGVTIRPLLHRNALMTLPDEEDPDWMSGPANAIEAAIETLEWDYEEKVVRAPPDSDDHMPDRVNEFSNLEDLVSYLNDIGWEPYNASAPREDGEWVFEYDFPAEELLGDLCSAELERMGWA